MCGIIGEVFRKGGQRPPLTADVLAQLSHRGPDGNGVFTDAHVRFGHTRLAIIDLSEAGRQPMASRDGRYVVTFNGEIYNYLELRAELEGLGERFGSHSDTEVLLVAYKVWGRQCVRRFRGMFAFALWDAHARTLFLARDRCGEKPLFFYRDPDRLAFASELKALLPLLGTRPRLDPAMVDMYLHYQYTPEPFTLLQGVHKLAAAHTLLISTGDWNAQPQRYWNVEDVVAEPVPADAAGMLAYIRDSVDDAVRMTLRSDVPVGVALSGGIDSGAIAALAQKQYAEPMHAFCVGYPGRPAYDERAQARALAESLGMIVHEVELPVDSFVSFFPELVRIMDEPIADPAAFGHYSVPKAARDHGIKVLLTGIGGDEVFWGYPWVTQAVISNQLIDSHPYLRPLARSTRSPAMQSLLAGLLAGSYVPGPVRHWAGMLKELGATDGGPTDQLRFYMAVPDFRDAIRLKPGIYGQAMHAVPADNPFRAADIGAREGEAIPAAIIRLLFETWLASNCLSLGDRVSMGVGVETRLPFLDVQLIERMMALRARASDVGLGQKAWLRAALKGVLPDEILARPKAGFQPPVREWLSGVVRRHGEVLRNGQLAGEGIVEQQKVEFVLTDMVRQGWPGLFFAYKLVLLEFWYQAVVAGV